MCGHKAALPGRNTKAIKSNHKKNLVDFNCSPEPSKLLMLNRCFRLAEIGNGQFEQEGHFLFDIDFRRHH